MPGRCATTGRDGPDSGENCLEVPQVQYLCGCGVSQRHPGSAGRCLRLVHRRDVQVLRRGAFAAVLQHFSASVHLDVEAQGGGDARSLTPGCSATPIRCTTDVYRQRHASSSTSAPPPLQPQQHNHNNTTTTTQPQQHNHNNTTTQQHNNQQQQHQQHKAVSTKSAILENDLQRSTS